MIYDLLKDVLKTIQIAIFKDIYDNSTIDNIELLGNKVTLKIISVSIKLIYTIFSYAKYICLLQLKRNQYLLQ